MDKLKMQSHDVIGSNIEKIARLFPNCVTERLGKGGKPELAIAMTKDGVKHIFFIAETKGTMSSMDLSAIEKAKIACAEKLFNSISTANVKYHKVATYQDLIDKMNVIG